MTNKSDLASFRPLEAYANRFVEVGFFDVGSRWKEADLLVIYHFSYIKYHLKTRPALRNEI